MLAEGVHGEQDIVTSQECRHAVWPVQHTHFNKDELFSIADVNAVAGLDDMKIPAALAILAFNAFDCLRGAVDGRIWYFFHQGGKRTGVIALTMVCNDEINLAQINFFLQVLDKIKTVRSPDCIDQHCFFFFNQISILTGTIID